MKQGNDRLTDSELHRFVDGELDEARAREVAETLAQDRELALRVERYREINRRLGVLYGDDDPASLAPRFRVALQRRGTPLSPRLAAAFALLVIGGLGGYLLRGVGQAPDFVRPVAVEAAFAHAVYSPEIRHPVEVDAAEREHLNAWLSKRLARPIAAPDLRQAGYDLIGGRLLPDAQRPAAQFMFESDSGERITLYIRHALSAQASAFVYAEQDALGIVYWVDDKLAYAVTGAADRAALTAAAELVYREVNP